VPRALLIGAAGFLGRHVHETVAVAGWHVQPASRAGRVRVDLGPDGALRLGALLDEYQPHAVINCAGAVTGDPAELIAANTTAPAVLVRAMLDHAPPSTPRCTWGPRPSTASARRTCRSRRPNCRDRSASMA